MTPEAQVSSSFILRSGRVFLHKSKKHQHLRLICFDEFRGVCIFKKVDYKWKSAAALAIEIPLQTVRKLESVGRFKEVDDAFRDGFMSWSDKRLLRLSDKAKAVTKAEEKLLEEGDDEEELPKQAEMWLEARDASYELIKDLVSHEDPNENRERLLALAYSPRTSNVTASAHAAKLNVPLQKILRLLHKFAWFGLDKNALLSRDHLKGSTRPFARRFKSKSGPISSIVKRYGEKYQGKAMAARDINNFILGISRFHRDGNLTLGETYEKILDTYYVQRNQHGLYPLRDCNCPSYRQFSYAAEIIIRELDLSKAIAGKHDGADLGVTGSHLDIGENVGDVADADGMVFNMELVSELKAGEASINCGKPQVIVIVDRGSGKVIGWHVYLGNESWKVGYRLAMFRALTSKRARLDWLGIDDTTTWPDDENIVPNSFYVDGGPGSSQAARQAMLRLGMSPAKAPPATPFWKAVMEGTNKHSQDAQAADAGGFRRTLSSRDKDKWRLAKLYAAKTVKEFEVELVKFFIRWNAKAREGARRTNAMRRDGVEASRNAIFSWAVKKMGGRDHRILREADVYESLLSTETAQVTDKGIARFGVHFNSARLTALRLRTQGLLNIKVMYDPSARWDKVFWRPEAGVIDQLFTNERASRDIGDINAYEIRQYLLADKAAVQKVNRDNQLSARQQRLVKGYAGWTPPKKQRNVVSNNIELVRTFEGQKYAESAPKPDVARLFQIDLAPGDVDAGAGSEFHEPALVSQSHDVSSALPVQSCKGEEQDDDVVSAAELFARRQRANNKKS